MAGSDDVLIDRDDLSDVLAKLYSAPPGDFVRVRSELAARARTTGDRARAKRVAALRKPTVAAAVVNRLVLSEPAAADRLREIGERLRAAQGNPDGIDRDLLRELSLERRTLVQKTADRALSTFAPSAGAAVRDEAVATLDAAVADPDVAERLGRLTHAEQWSGLGVVADTPRTALTVVPGGRPRSGRPTTASTSDARGSGRNAGAAPRKGRAGDAGGRPARASSALAAAEKKLSAARSELDEADAGAAGARDRVAELTDQLERLQQQLTRAEKDARTAVAAQRSARSRHREAQSARNRAARRAED